MKLASIDKSAILKMFSSLPQGCFLRVFIDGGYGMQRTWMSE